MCFPSAPAAPPPPAAIAPAPPPAAAGAPNPVMTNMYDPSSPESGTAAEKGALAGKAAGTSQLRVDLDPTTTNVDKGTGLQINK
tara:strand:+ start:420 stop:671 length:252 start_codon:yes stop_codon:yes gene_type:complete